MFARASLVALVLASPAWADSDYPAGLFERSPLNDTPPATSHQRHGQAKNPPRARASGGCPPLSRVALSVAATMLSRHRGASPPRSAPALGAQITDDRERWPGGHSDGVSPRIATARAFFFGHYAAVDSTLAAVGDPCSRPWINLPRVRRPYGSSATSFFAGTNSIGCDGSRSMGGIPISAHL
jgi:hypothetical protein